MLFGTYNLVEANLSVVSKSFARRLWGFQRWLNAEILIALREINYIHTTSRLPRVTPPTVHLGGNEAIQEGPSMEAFTDWLNNEFIGSNYHVHQFLFTSGRNYAALFDPTLRGWLPDDELDAKTKDLASTVLQTIAACRLKLRSHKKINREDILRSTDEHTQILFGSSGFLLQGGMGHAKRLIQNLNMEHLVDLFKSRVLTLCDQVFDDIFFGLAPPNAAAVDWEWFQAGIRGMLSRGINYCGVILYPNGTFATGELPTMYCQHFGTLDHDSEVFFCAWQGGITSVYKTTWEDLKKGSFWTLLGE